MSKAAFALGRGAWLRLWRLRLPVLGLAIGVAAIVSAVGISSSGQADLRAARDRLGTNLLAAVPAGQAVDGGAAALPGNAEAVISRIDGVTAVAAVGAVDARVSRDDGSSVAGFDGGTVRAARAALPAVLGGVAVRGAWVDAGTAGHRAAVLGARVADQLGIRVAGPDTRLRIGGQPFVVTGILHPVELVPELDGAVFVDWESAATRLGFDGRPSAVYARAREAAVPTVRALLAAAANPANPDAVTVSRPSDALAVRRATDPTVTTLLLVVGAAALLLGGVAAAHTMDVAALRQRSQLGLHRFPGATRGRVRLRFFAASLLPATVGGLGGVLLGTATTGAYATSRGWPTHVPAWVVLGGAAAAVVIGAVAGAYPAIRVAQSPTTETLARTDALASPC